MAYSPSLNGGRINLASVAGNTAGVSASYKSGTVYLSGGNNITLSQASNSITVSRANYTVQTQNSPNLTLSGNTTGALAHISSGTMTIAGGNQLTLSQAGNAISFAHEPAGTRTMSRFEYPNHAFMPLSTVGQGSLSLHHMYVPYNVTGTAAKIGGSMNVETVILFGNAATARLSLWMGIYTLNGSVLSLSTQGSTLNSVTWDGNNGATTLAGGMRQLTVSMSINMTPGEYWMGANVSTQSSGQTFGFTAYGNDNIVAAANSAALLPIGSSGTAARDVMLFQGIHTSVGFFMPSSIANNHINNTGAGVVQRAAFYNAVYNATY